MLVEEAGRVVSAKAILDALWGSTKVTRVTRLHAVVHSIRAKLELAPGCGVQLLSERQVGYRLIFPTTVMSL